MNISSEHILSKKKVGKIGNVPVIEIATTGGLHLVFAAKGGKFENLGAGPHRAVARHIAQKREPEIQWTDLSKADYIEPEHFQGLIPRYEGLTARIRSLQGLE